MEKQCKTCGIIKDETEFAIHHKESDGRIYYRSHCKECFLKNNRSTEYDYNNITDKVIYKKVKQMADSARSRVLSPSKRYKSCYNDLENPFGFENVKEMREYIYDNFYDNIKIMLENNEVPSIDRIDSSIGYAPYNLQILPVKDNTLRGVETRKRQVLMLTPPEDVDGISLVLFDTVTDCGKYFGIDDTSHTSKISNWIKHKGNYKPPEGYSFVYFNPMKMNDYVIEPTFNK